MDLRGYKQLVLSPPSTQSFISFHFFLLLLDNGQPRPESGRPPLQKLFWSISCLTITFLSAPLPESLKITIQVKTCPTLLSLRAQHSMNSVDSIKVANLIQLFYFHLKQTK